jgi:hypothetical protein
VEASNEGFCGVPKGGFLECPVSPLLGQKLWLTTDNFKGFCVQSVAEMGVFMLRPIEQPHQQIQTVYYPDWGQPPSGKTVDIASNCRYAAHNYFGASLISVALRGSTARKHSYRQGLAGYCLNCSRSARSAQRMTSLWAQSILILRSKHPSSIERRITCA